MNRDFVIQVYGAGSPPPHGFQVNLSEDEVLDPETKEMVTVYYLLFKNSKFQALPRKQLTDVAVWLKQKHDQMRSMGIRVLIQPIFDTQEGLAPDALKYKIQEIINKKT